MTPAGQMWLRFGGGAGLCACPETCSRILLPGIPADSAVGRTFWNEASTREAGGTQCGTERRGRLGTGCSVGTSESSLAAERI